ncbi:MAG TPA: hypothetical protein VGI04_01915 [Neobacillus sp.]|jgi:hypothetical protein
MFDPTAFDNMKVVLEGALYDLDILGEIIITDRNDLINTAKMQRSFDLCFKLAESKESTVSAKIQLESKLDNLAAELFPSSLSKNLAGCNISLQFVVPHAEKIEDFHAIESLLVEIWGSMRKISQCNQYNPLAANKIITNVIIIEFDRLITEEQMDDLIEMTDFMITTIKRIEHYLNKTSE